PGHLDFRRPHPPEAAPRPARTGRGARCPRPRPDHAARACRPRHRDQATRHAAAGGVIGTLPMAAATTSMTESHRLPGAWSPAIVLVIVLATAGFGYLLQSHTYLNHDVSWV